MKTVLMALLTCTMVACMAEPAQDIPPAPGPVVDIPATSTGEQSIIGGATDPGDPCVVGLFAHLPGSSTGSICTGAVIGPRTILTAAHCVSPQFVPAGSVIDVVTGTTCALTGIQASSTTFDPLFNPNNLFACHDIGIVHTLNPLPFPICPRAGVNFGLPVRIVGYGSNTHTNLGVCTKRTVTTNIVAASNCLLQIGNSNQQTCHGDSGGPAFQSVGGRDAVVAVTSFGQDFPPQVCFGGGFSGRVDFHAAFINANTF